MVEGPNEAQARAGLCSNVIRRKTTSISTTVWPVTNTKCVELPFCLPRAPGQQDKAITTQQHCSPSQSLATITSTCRLAYCCTNRVLFHVRRAPFSLYAPPISTAFSCLRFAHVRTLDRSGSSRKNHCAAGRGRWIPALPRQPS